MRTYHLEVSNQLTHSYIRRIDLISKLVAPLFVSLLTTAVSYPFSVAFLLGLGLVSMIFEFICMLPLPSPGLIAIQN